MDNVFYKKDYSVKLQTKYVRYRTHKHLSWGSLNTNTIDLGLMLTVSVASSSAEMTVWKIIFKMYGIDQSVPST